MRTAPRKRRFEIEAEPAAVRTHESTYQDALIAYEKRDLPKPEDRTHRGVKGPSVIMGLLYFNLIWGFAIDYMHADLLGIVKTHMKLIFEASRRKYWLDVTERTAIDDIYKSIDERLLRIKPPTGITRVPRSISMWKCWKASEWRTNILCTFLYFLERLSFLLQSSVLHCEVDEAHNLVMEYCRLFHMYFDVQDTINNLHLLTHLKQNTHWQRKATASSHDAMAFVVWGGVKSHAKQYDELRTLFRTEVDGDQGRDCPMAHHLAELHEDGSHRVYLAFLVPILKKIAAINVAFQRGYADISGAYAVLRTFINTMARRILRPEAISSTQVGGMVSLTEMQALKTAMLRQENFLPLELVGYSGEGGAFSKAIVQERLSEEQKVALTKAWRKIFLQAFVEELLSRLPSCVESVTKMRAFVPSVALSVRGRPRFSGLPKDLIRLSEEAEEMASQWEKLGSMTLQDFCPEEDNLEEVDIVKFWAAAGAKKSGGGDLVFNELAGFILSCLTLPLSNAVVERLFSVLAVVKTKLRNRMGLEMINSILRIRTFLHAKGLCCVDFHPTPSMIANFTSSVLFSPSRAGAGAVGSVEEEGEGGACSFSYRGDEDEDTTIIPQWDEMLDLVDEVDREL
ncbi:Phenylalanine--tRNA ligase alpha subunit, partial [Frankliniella fusca]